MTERNDVLVADYLSRVSRATAGLPPDQRDELLRDLQEHIENGRSELTHETEAEVREILDRLGEPSLIARAAAEDAAPAPYGPTAPYAPTVPSVPAAPYPLTPHPPVPEPTTKAKSKSHLVLIIAIAAVVVLLALCVGTLFFASGSSQAPAPAPAVPS